MYSYKSQLAHVIAGGVCGVTDHSRWCVQGRRSQKVVCAGSESQEVHTDWACGVRGHRRCSMQGHRSQQACVCWVKCHSRWVCRVTGHSRGVCAQDQEKTCYGESGQSAKTGRDGGREVTAGREGGRVGAGGTPEGRCRSQVSGGVMFSTRCLLISHLVGCHVAPDARRFSFFFSFLFL